MKKIIIRGQPRKVRKPVVLNQHYNIFRTPKIYDRSLGRKEIMQQIADMESIAESESKGRVMREIVSMGGKIYG